MFDCCHSGSACELPYVFRPDEDGNVNLVDTIKKGVDLVRAAGELLEGGFSMSRIDDAKMLLGGATDFFNGLHHRGDEDVDEDGLAPETFEEHWETEGKDVWMFSGCADNQTSADTSIAGAPTGAMSWAFVRALRENPEQSYINVGTDLCLGLRLTDYLLGPSKYPRGTRAEVLADSPIKLWR